MKGCVELDKLAPSGARGKANSKDVAKMAGVAQSTVSYYLNGSRPVSKAARARIDAAIKALGYHPNSSARTLRTQRTNLITLIERLSYEYDGSDVTPYLAAIVEEAYDLGYDVILNTTEADPDSLRRMDGRNICDGFILMDIKDGDERVPVAADIGLPTVVFGDPGEDYGLDLVYFDYGAAGKVITDYLACRKHHHVLFLDNNPEKNAANRSSRRLFDTLHEECAKADMDFRVVPFERERPQEVLDAVSGCLDDRLALIALQPRPTREIMDVLERMHVVPGRDLSLVSICPDSRVGDFALRPSNISPKPREVSRKAVRTLIERINDPDRPQVIAPMCSDHVTTRDTTVDYRS